MSKSAKKQKARERAAREAATPQLPVQLETRDSELETRAERVDEAAFERAAAAARAAGQEGEAAGTWLYNGDELSIKYVEAGPTAPRRLMVAAFRQGVVFQVEGDRQLSYRPGGWETALAKLLPSSG